MRIIVVDDESLIRMDLIDILESNGHTVIGEASNGVEAIDLTKKLHPDVVLMDVKMPELDGIQAARQIGYDHLAPVVLLTSFSQQDLITQARESGVYGYLIKPVREEDIVPTLEMARGRFLDDVKVREQLAELEQSLDERKYISKATGILMHLYNITEEESYQRIRTLSMKKQSTIIDICKLIIDQAENNK